MIARENAGQMPWYRVGLEQLTWLWLVTEMDWCRDESSRFDGKMYYAISNATEVVLEARHKLQEPNQPRRPRPNGSRGGRQCGRAAAGTVALATQIGAAFTDRVF